MAKDGRFYLRLTDEERGWLDKVAEAVGLEGNASACVRYMLREKVRELGIGGQQQAKRPTKAKQKR